MTDQSWLNMNTGPSSTPNTTSAPIWSNPTTQNPSDTQVPQFTAATDLSTASAGLPSFNIGTIQLPAPSDPSQVKTVSSDVFGGPQSNDQEVSGTLRPSGDVPFFNEYQSIHELLYEWQHQLSGHIEEFHQFTEGLSYRDRLLNEKADKVALLRKRMDSVNLSQKHVETTFARIEHGKRRLEGIVSALESELSQASSHIPQLSRDQSQRLDFFDKAVQVDSRLLRMESEVKVLTQTRNEMNLERLERAPQSVAEVMDTLAVHQKELEMLAESLGKAEGQLGCISDVLGLK